MKNCRWKKQRRSKCCTAEIQTLNFQHERHCLALPHGCIETDCRIPVYKKGGPQPAKITFYKIHARHQPAQPADFYSLPDHSFGKTVEIN